MPIERGVDTPDQVTETAVTFRYPRGRSYEATLNRELHFGEQLEMFGRTWTVVLEEMRRRSRKPEVGRVVWVPAESTTAA
jgi:hypothetical protein